MSAPDCERAGSIDEAQAIASGSLGQYRRASGWDEYASQPRYANEQWRMEGVFLKGARTRAKALNRCPAT
jgi:hypothetical protein